MLTLRTWALAASLAACMLTANGAQAQIRIDAVTTSGEDVPEPASPALIGLGVLGLIIARRKH